MIVRATDPAARPGLDALGLVWVEGVTYLDGPPDAVEHLVAVLRSRSNRRAERALDDPIVPFPGVTSFDEVDAVPPEWTATAAATGSPRRTR